MKHIYLLIHSLKYLLGTYFVVLCYIQKYQKRINHGIEMISRRGIFLSRTLGTFLRM